MSQRTNYKRQRIPVGTLVPTSGMAWQPLSLTGATMVVALIGSTEGLVIDGVPPINDDPNGYQVVSCQLSATVGPSGEVCLDLEWDTPPAPGDTLRLDNPFNGVRNRVGGQMNAALVKWPAGSGYAFGIQPGVGVHSATAVEVSFTSDFGPVCLGDGFVVENQTQLIYGSFTGWLGGLAIFDFGSPIVSGDVINIPADQPMCTTPYGGTSGSYNAPV